MHTIINNMIEKQNKNKILNGFTPSTSLRGFTIVELIVVISIIGILAAISIVSYGNWQKTIIQSQLKSDLSGATTAMESYRNFNNGYPLSIPSTFTPSAGVTMTGGSDDGGKTYCIDAVNSKFPSLYYHIDFSSSTALSGACPSPYIQTITAANCPSTRTQVQDARDSHTYWIQKLIYGKCWMLTNLGYAGSGTNTYGDAKTLTSAPAQTYTVAGYYTPTGSNITTEPTAPSTSTTGTGQYGYLYNWCAATGGDLASSGCSSTITTPLPVTTASICPSGWRLPTGNGGEFGALNTAINGGSTTTDAGLIGTLWLAQRGGHWYSGFYNQASSGYYWSSTQNSATSAYSLYFNSTVVGPAGSGNKNDGFAVRCIAV